MKKHRLIGPPGTGKTTYLVNKLEELLETYSCKRIAYCSFTKAAVEEASSRVIERFKLSESDTYWFRTIHSIGYALLQYKDPWKMVVMEDKKLFLEQEFKGSLKLGRAQQIHDEDEGLASLIITNPGKEGINAEWLFKINDYILMNYPDSWTDETFLEDKIDLLLLKLKVSRDTEFGNPSDIIAFCKTWDVWKQDNKRYEFIDMLYQCWLERLPLDVDVLIVDEFQDLTRIQYLLFEIWSEGVQEVWIAGDPNQAIYGFGGGSPRYLNDYDGETIFLDLSHRLPKNILEYSKQILPGDQWLSKLRTANELDGEIVFDDEADIADSIISNKFETIFVLCRTNKTVNEIAAQLAVSGVLFNRFGKQFDLTGAFLELYAACQKYLKKEELKRKEVKRLLNHISRQYVIRGSYAAVNAWITNDKINPKFSFLNKKKRLLKEDFLKFLNVKPSDEKLINLVCQNLKSNDSLVQSYFLENGLELGLTVDQMKEPKITVGTIHKSKGREADLVVIANKRSFYEDDEDLTDPEEERRVWYVAATRARQSLVIIEIELYQGTVFLPRYIEVAQ